MRHRVDEHRVISTKGPRPFAVENIRTRAIVGSSQTHAGAEVLSRVASSPQRMEKT